MSDSQVVISVGELVKSFADAASNEVRVLDGVTFDVLRGETMVIMGGSGCGKSTLLNCLIGEYPIDSGRILYQTKDMPEAGDIIGMTEGEFNEIRKRFGILFQSGALFNSLTVSENVALPLAEHSEVDPAVIDFVVTMKLQQVKMLGHRDKLPAQLSGGQKKRAALARATALDPEILFYDEPADDGPVQETAGDLGGGHARDGERLSDRGPDGHAGQGPGAADRRAERIRGLAGHTARRADRSGRAVDQPVPQRA
ncbi:MAG: ABC transporter ATP-binding protein [Planctomycetota bacterium]|jgi:phospholipid/cholesterol/gamma-HCH transport system ATP-binding protein